jgi:thiol-disulfide isomerase/thioredoxin
MDTRRQYLKGLTGALVTGALPLAGCLWTGAATAQTHQSQTHQAQTHQGLRFFPSPVAAPPLALPGLDGDIRALAAMAGRGVLVAFWATWCAPCRVELPALLRLQHDLDRKGYTVIAVNVGEAPDKVRAFLNQIDAGSLNVALDQDRALMRPWRIAGLPLAYGVNSAGLIRFSVLGAVDWDQPSLRQAVLDLNNAESVNEHVEL